MSAETDALVALIVSTAAKAQALTSNGNTIEQHQLSRMAEALKILNDVQSAAAANTAISADRPGFGLRFQQVTPVYP